jgi:hypothetical protein
MCNIFNEKNELWFNKDNDVVFFPWNKPGERLSEELSRIWRFNKDVEVFLPAPGSYQDFRQLKELEPNEGGNIFVWGHGSPDQPIIANDPVGDGAPQTLTAGELAAVLINWGLPRTFSGNIVLWTCWGGLPNGLAQMLRVALLDLTMTSKLRTWGVNSETLNMVDHLPRLHSGIPPADYANMQISNTRPATRGDVVLYGPPC